MTLFIAYLHFSFSIISHFCQAYILWYLLLVLLHLSWNTCFFHFKLPLKVSNRKLVNLLFTFLSCGRFFVRAVVQFFFVIIVSAFYIQFWYNNIYIYIYLILDMVESRVWNESRILCLWCKYRYVKVLCSVMLWKVSVVQCTVYFRIRLHVIESKLKPFQKRGFKTTYVWQYVW